MSKQKEFYDKPFFSIINHIFWFLQGGLYFIILNIPLLLFYTVTSFDSNQFNILLLFLCFIPFGLALGALYSTMNELVREKDISFSSYFFNTYKDNFKSNLKLWIVELGILTILFIDFQYFYLNMPQLGIHIIFAILGILTFVIGLYAFPINCRFNMSLKDILLSSLYYSIKRLPVTILKLVVTVLSIYLTAKVHALLVLFIPSMLCYLLTYYDKPMLLALEKKSLNQQNILIN